ncbi:hypothetical protein [Flavobacterium noncentrifugens]|nr:hypothetical protein [Flavobacterium noncentrifugens]
MRFRNGNLSCFVWLLVLTVTLTNCSPKIKPAEAYKMLQGKYIKNDNQTSTARQLELEKDYADELNSGDSVFVSDTKNHLYSYYKVYNIRLETDKKYKISLSSLCDCWGFKKYLFIPAVIGFDQQENPADAKLEKENVDFGYEFGPLSLNTSYILDSNYGGNFNFFVFSANKDLNQELYTFLTLPIPIPVKVKSTLVGKFHIKIEELKP